MLSGAKEGATLAVSKMRGCMVGSLLGDCLGSAFENEEIVSKVVLKKYFDKLEGPYFKAPFKMYTDDTAMTKSVAESLIHNGGFNEKDMAKRFVDEYFQSPKRGYGQNVVSVFHKLQSTKLKDVWLPAKQQFEGSGSYGNGGAMRIAPVALFCHNNYSLMLNVASKTTKLTHTNYLGVNGALLQCIAVHHSFKQDPNKPLDVNKFTDELIDKMSQIEKEEDIDFSNGTRTPYQDQLQLMKDLLAKTDELDHTEEVVKTLGNSIAALYSVPTAIFCFLRSQRPIKSIESNNPFRRTIQYSISLGGDTDTIASMAGALSGAFHGYEIINQNVQKHCEAVDKMLSFADELCSISET